MRAVIFALVVCLQAISFNPIYAAETAPAATAMAPGLLDDISEPLFEEDTFPLAILITLYPESPLETYRGRCVSLAIFGADQTVHCEKRMSVTFRGNDTSIHWFAIGQEAIGLESAQIVDPPKDRVFRFQITKVHRLAMARDTSEFALGSCRMDAFFLECHTIGKSGRIDVTFATVGGPPTQQYPVEDPIFRYRDAEIFTARGQCITLKYPGDMTPYCASFVGQATLGRDAILSFFTADGHLVFGFYGLTKTMVAEPDGAFTLPITYLIRFKGKDAGTAPVKGTCHDRVEAERIFVDCKVKTTREGAVIEGSFESMEPWHKAVRPKTD